MSPYLACMNTLCAWPSPDRLSDALVCLRQSDRDDDNQTDGKAQDMVPMEEVDQNDIGKKKIGRHPRRYWRFIGLRNDGSRIDAFIEKNRTLLAKPHPQPSAQQIHTDQQSLNQNQIMNQADLLPSEDVPGRVASHSNGVPQATKFNQFQSAKRTMRVGMMMTPFPLEHPPPMQDFQLPSKLTLIVLVHCQAPHRPITSLLGSSLDISLLISSSSRLEINDSLESISSYLSSELLIRLMQDFLKAITNNFCNSGLESDFPQDHWAHHREKKMRPDHCLISHGGSIEQLTVNPKSQRMTSKCGTVTEENSRGVDDPVCDLLQEPLALSAKVIFPNNFEPVNLKALAYSMAVCERMRDTWLVG
ncbi:hypothetical protein BY996DRAFT_8690624 [Phakopsora pachyrhizi]|nr:hypothetical protein BY996DRAFT_8696845 [Phakopsora pachyrhizi]KAI8448538.1 hypothetical protein BY996DRAFT_8690624 [Phakopsora pachyrhizi]